MCIYVCVCTCACGVDAKDFAQISLPLPLNDFMCCLFVRGCVCVLVCVCACVLCVFVCCVFVCLCVLCICVFCACVLSLGVGQMTMNSFLFGLLKYA